MPTRFWPMIAFCTICFAACGAFAGESSEFARHAPGNTCLAVFSSDVSKTCAGFQKTSLGEALGGPDFKPFIGELTRLNRASPLYLRPMFGFDWSELTKVSDPGGLLIFPLDDQSTGVAWLFISAAKNGGLPPCLDAASRFFVQQGFQKTSIRQTGAALTIFQPPMARKSEPPRVMFVAEQFYGIANSRAAVEAVLKVTADQSLAAQKAFKDSLPSPTKEPADDLPDAQFFLRPVAFWELAQEPTPPSDSSEDNALTTARRLGLETLQAVAGRAVFAGPPPCQWEIQAKLLAPRPLDKAMRLLEVQPGAFPSAPAWIDANITSAWFWRWNFSQAMKGFANLFDEGNEPGPDGEGLFDDLLDGLRDDPEGVRVDLRTELFERMGPDVIRVDDHRGPQSDTESDHQRWVYAAALSEPAKVIETLTRFYRGDKRVAHSRSGDYEVWTVGEGASLFVEGESESLVTVRGLAVGRGQLLFSMDIGLLNAVLAGRNDGPRLLDDPAWKRLWDYLVKSDSPKTAGRALVRLDQMLEPGYQVAASEKTEDAEPTGPNLWQLLLLGTTEPVADFPVAAWPKFDRLRPALPAAGMNLSQGENGWTIRIGALDPAASK
jgi:hypothetical protein